MKTFGIIGTTALFLVLASSVPVLAQEHQEEAKPAPAQHEQQAKPAAPARQAPPAKQEAAPKQAAAAKPTQQPQPKAAKQETQTKPEPRAEQAKAAKPETQNTQEARNSPAAQGQPRRSPVEEQTQRSAPALRLSARNSTRIPDARFHSNFGQGHEFRIGTPTIVGGYSRFQYGGYWFGFVQPWPAGWYYTDDVYVDYIDGGYYLCNPYYPGVRVAISMVG